jgi:hypothetical protein
MMKASAGETLEREGNGMYGGFRLDILLCCLAVLLMWCFASSPVQAQVPETIKGQYHSEKELSYKVITGRNKSDIALLERDPGCCKIVIIQILPKDMTGELGESLMKWVRQGGTLWFYDSRLARYFGMEELPLSSQGLNNRKMEGEYGETKKYPGVAVTAIPFGEHPVLTGVTGAVVFIIEVGPDSYSAVKSGGPVKALLKTDLTKEAAVAALKEEGKGKIVFKALLWESQVDGARFQANIKEYSAGFPIPKISSKQSKISDDLMVEKKGILPQDKADFILLSDGRTIWGKVLNESLVFETPDKSMKVACGGIKELECDVSSGVDRLLDKDDKKLTGFLSAKGGIQFLTPSGSKVTLEKQDIKKIFFNRSKEAEVRGRINSPENSRGTR